MGDHPWADPGSESFATKLQRLFASVVRSDRSERTHSELAGALDVPESDVADWLAGRSEPTVSQLLLIADFFFGVADLEVFGDTSGSREINRQLAILAAVRRRAGSPETPALSGELTPEALLGVIKYLADSAKRDSCE